MQKKDQDSTPIWLFNIATPTFRARRPSSAHILAIHIDALMYKQCFNVGWAEASGLSRVSQDESEGLWDDQWERKEEKSSAIQNMLFIFLFKHNQQPTTRGLGEKSLMAELLTTQTSEIWQTANQTLSFCKGSWKVNSNYSWL